MTINLNVFNELQKAVKQRALHVLEVAYNATGNSYYITEDDGNDLPRDLDSIIVSEESGKVSIKAYEGVEIVELLELPNAIFTLGTDEEIEAEVLAKEEATDVLSVKGQLDTTLVHLVNSMEMLMSKDKINALLEIVNDREFKSKAMFFNTRQELVEKILNS